MVVRTQSGSVHLLNPFASRVMRMLLESPIPLSPDDLSSALQLPRSDFDLESSRAEVEESLEEFERLGIIEPGPS